MPQEKPPRAKRREPAHDEDDGERLCCGCDESFNVNESGGEEYCPRCACMEKHHDPSHSSPEVRRRRTTSVCLTPTSCAGLQRGARRPPDFSRASADLPPSPVVVFKPSPTYRD
jgi:hypothetical protein